MRGRRWGSRGAVVRFARAVAFHGGLLLASVAAAAAQQGAVHGIITSSETSSPVEGAVVVLETDGRQVYGAVSDRNGFYQIGGIEPGSYALRVQHLGFASGAQTMALAPGQTVTLNVRVDPRPVDIEGVVVSGERGAAIREMGRQRITPGDLRLVPVPAGSGDLATYLQILPGVTTTGDRGGQLFVRGGTPAENLVLVDGIPIYQPFHILGFFSIFPETLVSSVDFYASGFGARYSGRTSSVLDVALRDGNPNELRADASVSPFLVEALAEGPAGPGVSWIASARRSLVEETSELLLGERQPITFDSQFFKLSVTDGDDRRCSGLALRTSDRGRLDPEETVSHVGWTNLLLGGRCVLQFSSFLRLFEVSFSAAKVDNSAVSRGSSRFRSGIWRMQHDAHVTSMIGATPITFGYHMHTGFTDFDLAELFGLQEEVDPDFSVSGYAETQVPLGSRIQVRPGVVLTAAPRTGVEPRLRASWEPFGRPGEQVQGALGFYRQYVVGTSDTRDVSSVFVSWMEAPGKRPVEATHASLGWQQSLGAGFRWSLEGYYKRVRNIPVPVWRAVALYTTRLSRADGDLYGADLRVEYGGPQLYAFLGYGYGWNEYEASSDAFGTWFGDPVQRYHPPHDRRHQVNAVGSLRLGSFDLSARWQLGSGLPFTRPMGFDEAFDYTRDLHDVSTSVGIPRAIVARPFTGRLPVVHRLDLSVARDFDLSIGRLTAQVGAINAYDRRNMFYYDLYSGRRVDQLPLAPYASLRLQSRKGEEGPR